MGRLVVLATAGGFMSNLISRVLTYAAAEFSIERTSSQTNVLAVVRLGFVFALIGTTVADRFGRRRVLAVAVAVAVVMTALTGAAPTWGLVGGAQLVGRNVSTIITVLVAVIAAEQLPAGSRAWASGVLGMSYALGAGLVLGALPLAGVAPWGWRLVTLVPLAASAGLWWALRGVPETSGFAADHVVTIDPGHIATPEAAAGSTPTSEVARVSTSAPTTRAFPWRNLALLVLIFVAINVFGGPSAQLQADYLRNVRHMDPGSVSVFLLLTNLPGALGVIAGGRLGDTRGRRAIAAFGLTGLMIQAVVFATSGPSMWVASVCSALIGGLAIPTVGALGPELFPTWARARANGWLNVASVGGGVVGVLAAGAMIDQIGYSAAMGWLAIAPALAIAALAFLPKTAGRDLDEINRA